MISSLHIACMNVERLEQKRELINLIRTWLSHQGFFELETPLLVPSPGMEVHLHGFKTKYLDLHGNSRDYFLPTSPEFALKKALGGKFEKVFEIARAFRNIGELGPHHHPEFNMLEWYRPGNYEDIMEDVSDLLRHISQRFKPAMSQMKLVLDQGVKRSSIDDCFSYHANLDLQKGMEDHEYWRQAAQAVLKENIPRDDGFEDIFFRVWIKMIEPKLGMTRPEIIFDYPASMAALSKLKQPDLKWSERFELYINGMEIGNAYSELTDSIEQLTRFQTSNVERETLGYSAHPIDDDLIHSVGKMKPTGGIAIGIERLLMVLTGETDIRQFFLLPME